MRRHTRYDVEGVDGTFLFNLEIDVKNLSVAGMAVQTTRSLSVGRRYVFTISKGDEEIRLAGRVAWCVLGGTRKTAEAESTPLYNAGIQFLDVLTSEAKGLMHLIEENAVLDLDKRIFGRFRLGAGTAVSVDAALEFEIRRISMSGMLAEVQGDAGKIATLEEVFPIEIAIGGGTFAASGRVAYVNRLPGRTGDDGRVELGVEFNDVTADSRKLLEEFIASVVESETGDQPAPDEPTEN
jgi:hypothetical protein